MADLEAFYRGAGERMETLMGAVNARPDKNRRMKWKKINSAVGKRDFGGIRVHWSSECLKSSGCDLAKPLKGKNQNPTCCFLL